MGEPKRIPFVLLYTLLVVSLLSGCISTTTGGFTAKASPEEALEKRVQLARQYIGDANWEDATRNLKIAQKIDANNADVHEAFALVYQSTGEYELAQENFKKAIRLDRKCSRCRNNYAAFLYGQSDFEGAVKQLEVVVEDTLYESRTRAFINLGLARTKIEDWAGAEEAFKRVTSMERLNSIALLELAQLRYRAGDYSASSKYHETYKLSVRQQSPRALWLGIRLARESGDRDAEASYGLALSNLYPNSKEHQAFKNE
ncbi:MAG: type IV pilus biogenesis/stability protein PilW [Halioglobus sp.]